MRVARNIFQEIATLGHDEDFEPPLPEVAVDHKPGSWEKIQAMCERVDRGEAIFHPDDFVEHQCTIEQERFKETEEVLRQKKGRARTALERRYTRNQTWIKNCVVCNDLFTSTSKDRGRITCSGLCLSKLKSKAAATYSVNAVRLVKTTVKICEYCGKSFAANRKNRRHKSCSKECASGLLRDSAKKMASEGTLSLQQYWKKKRGAG